MNYICVEVKLHNVQGDLNEVQERVKASMVAEFGDDNEFFDVSVEAVESA